MKKLYALFFLTLFCGSSFSQFSGVYSVPGSFTSVARAVIEISTYGVAGPVTVNIAAGYSEALTGPLILTTIGSSSLNTVTFRKNGTGANPILYPYSGSNTPGSSVQDGFWKLVGTDYVTIDGINLTELNSTNPATMEYGFGLFVANNGDGCQYNTIKNCVITLNRINNANSGIPYRLNGSRGIELVNAQHTYHPGGISAINLAGRNCYNKFYSNTIQNCNIGIDMIGEVVAGSNGPFPYADIGNEIGGTLPGTGNTIINYGGGGTLTASGIVTYGQQELNIGYNILNNNNGSGVTHLGDLYGIYTNSATAANVSIHHNTITVKGATTTAKTSAIENIAGDIYPSLNSVINNTVSINNNLIANCTQTPSTYGNFYGIWNQAQCTHLDMSSNTFSNNVYLANVAEVNLIYNTKPIPGKVTISNNLMINLSLAAFLSQPDIYAIRTPTGSMTTTLSINTNTFNNFYDNTQGGGNSEYISVGGPNDYLSIQGNNWVSIAQLRSSTTTLINNASDSQKYLSVANNSVIGGFTTISGDIFCYKGTGQVNPAITMSITGNSFLNISTPLNSQGTFYGFYCMEGTAQSMPRKLIYNNLLSTITTSAGGSFFPDYCLGIYAYYLGDAGLGLPSAIFNNTITAIHTTIGNYGMVIGNASPNYPTEIYSNEITDLESTPSGTIFGVQFNCGSSGANFYRNKIAGLSVINGSTQNGRVSGIECLSGTNINIYNNILGALSATNTVSSEALRGINIKGGTGYKIYYNSIHMPNITFGSSCISATTGVTMDLRNNLLVNPYASYGIVQTPTTLAGYDTRSNNNLWYSGPGYNYLYLGSTGYTSLSTAKTALVGRELNTVSENVVFASTTYTTSTYLSVNTAAPTLIEKGAMPIAGITTDYYGNPRNPNFPDIGAIEDNYTATNDIQSPVVQSGGLSTSACNTSAATFTALISDVSGVATGTLSPKFYYKINSGAYTGIAGTLSSGSSTLGVWTFNLSYATAINDVISYFLLAQDVQVTPNMVCVPAGGFVGFNVNNYSSAPTSPNTYSIQYTLNGTYTVGTSGTFTSLTQASNAYNNGCLTGPVTFELSNTLYSSAETFPILFKLNSDASATNSLLIRPKSGVASSINAASNTTLNAVIQFLNARYITLDGVNASGSSLSIFNNNTNFLQLNSDIWLASTPASGPGNKYISIKNTNLSGVSGYSTTGIFSSANTGTVSNTGAVDNDYITISGNYFAGLRTGVSAYGASSLVTGGADNWLVTNNTVGPVSSGTANISLIGMEFEKTSLSSVSNNTISNIDGNNIMDYRTGIRLGMGVSNSSITANTIRSVRNSNNSYSFGGIGIDVYTSLLSSNITIDNNMIADIGGSCSGSFTNGAIAGIRVGANGTTGGIKIRNNSIALTQGLGVSYQECVSAAAYFGYYTSGIDFRNNLLYSNLSFTYQNTSRTYGVYSHAPASAFSFMDYNSYFGAGIQGVPAYIGSANRVTLPAIAGAFGQNQNSKILQPVFTSSLDLHLDPTSMMNAQLNDLGTPIAGITNDIDNQVRSSSVPDIGADEYTATATCTGAAGGTISSASYSLCVTIASVALVPTGFSGGLGTIYQWEESPISGGTFTPALTGSNANTPYYTSGFLSPGTHYLRLNVTCPSATVTAVSNEVTVQVYPLLSPVISASSGSICSGVTTTLTANYQINQWSTGIFNSTVAVVSPTATTVYYGDYYTSCGIIRTPNYIVYVSKTPTVSASAVTNSVCANSPGTLTAVGSPTYINFTWSNGSSGATVNPTPSVATVYTVTGSQLNGCGSTATVALGTYPSPTVSISGPTVLCSAQTVSLIGTGVGSYLWLNNSSSSPTLVTTPVTTTVYSLQVTASGCATTKTHTVQLVNPQTPTITAPTSICIGQQALLSAAGGSLFTWSTGATTSTISPSPTITTTYSVVSGLGSCTLSSNKVVVVNPLPVLAISGNSSACIGQPASYSVSGAATYTWSTGSNATSIIDAPTTNTVYSVSGTSLGCVNSASISVVTNSLPVINIVSSATLVCANYPVTYTASGGNTYTWSTSNTGNTVTVYPPGNTIYTVNGTNANGCSSSATVAVSTMSFPVIAVTPASATVCAQSAISFTASGVSTYSWSNSGGNSPSVTYTPSASSVYTVSSTDLNNGCVVSKTVAVTTNSLPVISISGSTAVCVGQSVTLTSGGAASYSWNTGAVANTIVISPTVNTNYLVTGTNAAGCVSGTNLSVISNSVPLISIAQSTTVVCSLLPVTFTASGAGTYTWSSGSNNTVITTNPPSSTVYTVNGTNAAGCVSSKTVAITTNSLPAISINPASATVCSQSTISFVASGAGTYLWSNSGGANASTTYTPVSSAVYTVTGTDANNSCVASKTVAVTTNSLPVISISGNSVICFGQSTSLNATGANTYTWSTTTIASAISVSPVATTLYTLQGTDINGCRSNAAKTVNVNSLPVLTLGGSSVICAGDSNTLTINGASSYLWSTTGTGTAIVISPAGTTTYAVIGTDSNGCQNTASTTVNVNPLPAVSITGSTFVCSGNSSTLAANGAFTYSWNTSSSAPFITISPVNSSTYSVIGTDVTGCHKTATIVVSVISTPTLSVSGNMTVCAGNSTTLNANGANTYSWTNLAASNTIVVTPTITSTYTVTGTNSSVCQAVAQVTVTANPLPSVSASSNNNTICIGNQVTLTGSGASSYTWSGAISNGVAFSPSATTNYTVSGTDANNCKNSATIDITVNPLPTVTAISSASIICVGESVTFSASGAGTYTWSEGTIGSTLSVVPTAITSYTVIGTDANGCNGSITITQATDPCTGLSQLSTPNSQFIIYPNPNNGQFQVKLPGNGPVLIEVYNYIGQLILSDKAGDNYGIDIRTFANGIYVVRLVENGKTLKEEKIIKQ